MVEDTGETLRVDAYRKVNAPKLVEVEEDADGLPLAVRMPETARSVGGKPLRRQTAGAPQKAAVLSIEESWRIDDEWWRREPVSRLYYSFRLSSGHCLAIYKDMIDGLWYRQNY